MPSEKSVVTVDGLDVTVQTNPGNPLILLVRMAAPAMGVWDTIWDDFARSFTVAAFDLQQLPAAGMMDTPEQAFQGFAQGCVEVAAGLGFERFHIFGWNGGTQVAMRCAVDHGDRLQSCILLDPFFELEDMRRVEKAVEFKRVLFEHPDRRLYAFYWVMAGLTDDFLETRFDEVEKLVDARVGGDRFVNVDVDRFMRWVRALRRNWISDQEFARIDVPTLIVATELDRWHAGPTVSMAREVQKRIAGSRLEVIEKAGGLFLIENPRRFWEVAEPFVREASTLPFTTKGIHTSSRH